MIIKDFIRAILREFLCLFYYKSRRKKIDVGRGGKPLKPGITAVVAAKNEEFTIPICLKSLLGVADQIVCIDNGSTDNTMQEIEEFKRKHGNEVEIDVISLPGALLGDCRNAGLNATRYQWHFRCDADMICRTSGEESMIRLRGDVLKNNTPRAIQLPRMNITGDFFHQNKKDGTFIDEGENFLIWFNKDIEYDEFGKFDAIKVPIYYRNVIADKAYIVHCCGLKSVENLMHRFHYFTWREKYNGARTEPDRERIRDFKKFVLARNMFLFGTTDKAAVKWRYLRQLSVHFEKIDEEIDYPDSIKELMKKGGNRFEVLYRDGEPYTRIDTKDEELLNYRPTEEDLNWDIEYFFQRIDEEEKDIDGSIYFHVL